MKGDPDAAIARELRLRAPAPTVTRLSRRAVLVAAAGGSLVLAAATWWGLSPRRSAPSPSSATLAAPPPPEALAALPRDYLRPRSPAPPLGPPRFAGVGVAAVAPPTAGAASRPGTDPTPDALAAARASRLFAGSARLETASAPALPVQTNVSDGPRRTDLTASRTAYALTAGSFISAALITGLRSDLPGPVVAQVTEDVYGGPAGSRLLVPSGSRILGAYDSKVAFGQGRLLISWSRLILPDGRAIELGGEPAVDAGGFAGLQDGVDAHWGRLLGSSAISALLAVGVRAASGSVDAELVDVLRMGAGGAAGNVGAQLVGRDLDIPPTLTVRPGQKVRVLLTRDLVVEPGDGA
jgi:type IV secretion system protein VirB10